MLKALNLICDRRTATLIVSMFTSFYSLNAQSAPANAEGEEKGAAKKSTESSAVSSTNSSIESSSVTAIRERALKGDPDAQYLLGFFYASGEGLALDLKQAKLWLEKAAQNGDPRAQNCLGLLFDPAWYGSKSAADIKIAAEWYKRAASQGYASALHNLQVMKDSNLIAATETAPQLMLNRASLTDEHSQGAVEGPTSVFKHSAPAVVEVIGDGNYGSGVVAGIYEADLNSTEVPNAVAQVVTPLEKRDAKFEFFSNQKQQSQSLSGRYLIVFTNAHVLEGSSSFVIGIGSNLAGETLSQIQPVAACLPAKQGLDLAIMFVPIVGSTSLIEKNVAILPLYNEMSEPEKGARVFAIGNPERLVRTITQGLYNGIRSQGIQFDAPISHGSSGGALVDEKNRLLGITAGFVSEKESQNLNFAVPYTVLHKALSGEGFQCYVP